MGSTPSKQKKVNDKDINGGNKDTTGVSGPSSTTTSGADPTTAASGDNNRANDDSGRDTNASAEFINKEYERDVEKQRDQGKDFNNKSDVSNVKEYTDGDKDNREIPSNVDGSNFHQHSSVSAARGIKPDSRLGLNRNVLTNPETGRTNADAAPELDIIDMEDEFEEISEQTRSNYERKIPTIKWKDILPNSYKMDHPRRGKAIVINNENFMNNPKRKGTYVDYSRICLRLRKLQFDVTGYIDVTCQEITSAFSQIAKEDHSDADCFACVILSHGESDGIYGIDGIMKLDTLFKMFHASNCPSLAGKPKLFFIQACRGSDFDDGVDVSVDVTDAQGSFEFPEEEVEYRVPDEADFLISYSTTQGYYSWRNARKGTWYIQSLVHVLDHYGTVVEIQKLLTRVNKMVAQNFKSADPHHKNKTQMPSITSKLTKDLYFVSK